MPFHIISAEYSNSTKPTRLVYWDSDASAEHDFLAEMEYLTKVERWSNENKCGFRSSYGIFEFENMQQITLFMLKWS